MISKKTLIMSALLMICVIISAIPVNTLVTYPMPYPMKASQDGSIVVGQAGQASAALMWTEAGGVVTFGEGNLYDISENHLIAGEKLIDLQGQQVLQAGYFTTAGVFTAIPNPAGATPTDGFLSTAYAISADGSTIAGMSWRPGWATEAIKWTAATGTVSIYSANSARVNSLSQNGAIAGGWITADFGNRVPVYWDQNNTMHYLTTAEEDGEIMGVSPNGQYMCGYYYDGGFVKAPNQIYTIPAQEPMDMILANYVNSNGLTVGINRNVWNYTQSGFVYSPQMGYMEAHNYFISQGVTIPEGVSISGVSWVSDDNKTFIGFCYTNDGPGGYIIKLSEQAQISGQVTLNGGNGNLSNALITCGLNSVNADANGNYSISVAPGTYQLVASLNGYETQTSAPVTVTASQQLGNINFTLTPISNPATVQGTITLGNGNGLIENVSIHAGSYLSTPAANGQYSLYLPAGTHLIEINIDGYYPVTEQITVTANQILNKNYTLYTTGTPANANITINNPYTYDLTGAELAYEKVGDGYYQFKDVSSNNITDTFENGTYNLALVLPGYKTEILESVVMSAGNTTNLTFSPEKIYPAPTHLSGTSTGLMSWEKPIPLNAFYEDFENYNTNSSMYKNNPMWKPYNGMFNGENDGMVTDEYSYEGFNSLKLTETTDLLVDLHNIWYYPALNSGSYITEFNVFVPNNKCGHYNILRSMSPLEFTFEAFFKENGTLKYYVGGQDYTIPYNQNDWNHVKHELDLDNNIAKFYFNNVLIRTWQFDMNAYNTEIGYRTLSIIDFSGEPELNSTETGTFYLDNFAFYNVAGPGPDSYKVFLDSNMMAENINSLSYQLSSFPQGSHVIGASAMYGTHESVITSANVNFVPNDDNISTPLKDFVSNYPNPFNPQTTVSYHVAKEGKVQVEVYNVKGQKVKTLLNDVSKSGKHQIIWSGDNDQQQKVGSGIYFIRLKTEASDLKKKVILLK